MPTSYYIPLATPIEYTQARSPSPIRFKAGDVVTFKSELDWKHVTRFDLERSNIKLFPKPDSTGIVKWVAESGEYLRLEGCYRDEEFYSSRFILASDQDALSSKHYHVISKIRQLQNKRKANGYAF
jgi:hypothetical protein